MDLAGGRTCVGASNTFAQFFSILMLKRRLKMIESELWETCGGIIGMATEERLSLCPFLPYFKKSLDIKISFAAQVRY
ncbi:MAG TPA: hypothetical protein VN844_29795 [Pyrinomonadaceae bacterium]|nr:hypothetical protein [Pyrinomonadaceae bacterium]